MFMMEYVTSEAVNRSTIYVSSISIVLLSTPSSVVLKHPLPYLAQDVESTDDERK